MDWKKANVSLVVVVLVVLVVVGGGGDGDVVVCILFISSLSRMFHSCMNI